LGYATKYDGVEKRKQKNMKILVLLSLIPLGCILFSHYMNEFVSTFWNVFLLPTHIGGLRFPLTKVARVIVVDPARNARYLNNGSLSLSLFSTAL
jgi:hypothetical protein